MIIAKRFSFDAAHCLPTLGPDHKCANLHGHTYWVEIRVFGSAKRLDPHGMLADYERLAEAWKPLHALLDHKYLNDVPGLEKPTTEHLAIWIVSRLREFNPWLRYLSVTEREVLKNYLSLQSVRIEESTGTWCEVFADEVADQ
jgi:6-pyruvoyltetrahydropterin/6-carboxytetrahydropterin synthase